MTKDALSSSPVSSENVGNDTTIKTVERDGMKLSFRHNVEFEELYKAIFQDREYDFNTANPAPRIIDVGSHIGMATLFFKKQYPAASVLCFEPNPASFSLLQRNISQNGLEDVTLVNAAVAERKGEAPFYVENPKDGEIPYTWGDSAAKNKWVEEDPDAYKTIPVKTTILSDYLDEPVDLLKLDVEGSEEIVLRETASKLHNVKQLFMEFHGSSTNPGNDSGRILELLKNNGFSCKVSQDGEIVDEEAIRKDDPYWLIIHAYK